VDTKTGYLSNGPEVSVVVSMLVLVRAQKIEKMAQKHKVCKLTQNSKGGFLMMISSGLRNCHAVLGRNSGVILEQKKIAHVRNLPNG
jgi:hypothetical protein